ncbi:erythromycin esterase family protein [Mucilaginibacter sp. PAMB04274]|uniref:erythromycin esterase family protein n=1 Tax=Mucilaginibacter sp. PAMB04274 TaxID=3138568 RepID=UPI0031F6A548
MLKILSAALLTFCTCTVATGQDLLQKYVKDNAVRIAAPSPTNSDYSDLNAIGEAIADARVVMLGEADHSDGTTLALKSRVVKYLHDKKGFNVLLFENDFYSLNQGWDSLSKDRNSIKTFFYSNLYPMWSKTEECADLLYDYLPETFKGNGPPLKISGFDNQLNGSYARNSLKKKLHQYLSDQSIDLNSSAFLSYLSVTDSLMNTRFKDEGQFNNHLNINRTNFKFFSHLSDDLLSRLGVSHSTDYCYQLINSLKGLAEQRLHHQKNKYVSGGIRDAQMAQNLAWLLQHKYAKEKVIVWAANYHIIKNKTELVSSGFLRRQPNMSTALFNQLPGLQKQTFILTTVSSEFPDDKRNYPKLSNGFDTWVQPDIAFGFINIKAFQNLNPAYNQSFPMKTLGHSDLVGKWTQGMDGILYIKVNRKAKTSAL